MINAHVVQIRKHLLIMILFVKYLQLPGKKRDLHFWYRVMHLDLSLNLTVLRLVILILLCLVNGNHGWIERKKHHLRIKKEVKKSFFHQLHSWVYRTCVKSLAYNPENGSKIVQIYSMKRTWNSASNFKDFIKLIGGGDK